MSCAVPTHCVNDGLGVSIIAADKAQISGPWLSLRQGPLHPPRPQAPLFSSFSPPPFIYFTDPKKSSTVLMTPTTSSSSTLACKSIYHSWPSFHRAKVLHSPDESLTCLAGYFGYVALEVIKTPTETHTYLVDRYYLFDTHTQTRHKFISLSHCAQLLPPTFSSAATSLFVPTTLPQNAQNWASQPVPEPKPSSSSDVSPPSIYSIVPPLGRLYKTLGLPPTPPTPRTCHPQIESQSKVT